LTSLEAFLIVRIVKGGGLIGTDETAAVIADIKDLRRNVVKEGKETANAFGNVRLACGE